VTTTILALNRSTLHVAYKKTKVYNAHRGTTWWSNKWLRWCLL